MHRATEYRSNYVVPSRALNACARVDTGRAAAGTVSQYHLRKSRGDMIPATATAIPTAQTHRSPKRTTYARTTYTVVRTPNLSAVYHDPYAAVPSADVSGTNRQRLVPSRGDASPRDHQQQRISRSASCVSHPRERQLQSKVDLVTAKNRDLEMQLMQLKREMMMMRAANSSSSRLYPPPRQRSYSGAAPIRGGPQQQRAAAGLPPPQRSVSTTCPDHQRPSSSRRQPRTVTTKDMERTLHLVDELRDALVHQTSVNEARNTSKRKLKKKMLKRDEEPKLVADQLRSAIESESALYARVSAEDRAHVHQSEHGAILRSPARPVQQQQHVSRDPPIAYEDDEAFESLQKSYWSQSQAILEQLDRKLRSLTTSTSSRRY
jgi:hypothetical protein